MSLQGLPDFRLPIQGGRFHVFHAFDGVAEFFVTPDRLEVAPRADARPDFMLEYVRGSNPMLPPVPYGVLNVRLRGHYPTDEALALLRNYRPDGLMTPAIFSSGFLRLRPVGDLDGQSDLTEITKPVPLAWNGLGVTRLDVKLSTGATTLIKRSLQSAVANLYAAAEVELIGIAPRLALRVHFDPAALLHALLALGDKDGQVARGDVVGFFRTDPARLPLTLEGAFDGVQRDDFAEAMADQVRSRFGTFIPSPKPDAIPYMRLPSPAVIGSGSFIWDLSEPLQTARPFVFGLDPFEAAHQLVQTFGLDAVFRETTVPPIQTGAHRIAVTANLPAKRPGVVAAGATLRAPPHLPQRAQAALATVELQPPDDNGSALLRLAPGEALQYFYSTYVVMRQSLGVKQLNGPELAATSECLGLTVADFPVDFISVEAEPALLDAATVRVIARWPDSASTSSSSPSAPVLTPATMVALGGEEIVDLKPAARAAAIALPKGVEGATLRVVATERGGTGVLERGPLPAADTFLGLYFFREYGPQKVTITCVFGQNADVGAIDLLPEGCPEQAQDITTLRFTREQPVREWAWFVASPFHPGYRFRPYRGPGLPPQDWSEIRAPFEPLEVHA